MRISLFVAAAVLSASLAAHGSTIDFNSLSGANGALFTTYAEAGFLVANSAGQYFVAKNFGNPVPDIFSRSNSPDPTVTTSSSVTITAIDGGQFTFASVDLGNLVGLTSYSFTGSFGASLVYSQNGSVPSVTGVFTTVGSTSPATELTSLTIVETGSSYNLDNIVVNETAVTPEPTSVLLLGTGLLGVTGVMWRRVVPKCAGHQHPADIVVGTSCEMKTGS